MAAILNCVSSIVFIGLASLSFYLGNLGFCWFVFCCFPLFTYILARVLWFVNSFFKKILKNFIKFDLIVFSLDY